MIAEPKAPRPPVDAPRRFTPVPARPRREDATFIIRAPGEPPLRVGRRGCITLGRHSSNEVVLDDPSVSRFHARLVWPRGEETLFVEDLGSHNGTFVGDRPVTTRTPLPSVATLRLGRVRVEVERDGGELPAAAEEACRLFDESCVERDGMAATDDDLRALLLELERARRTVTLFLERGARRARVTLADGRIVAAEGDAAEGALALLSILEGRGPARYSLRRDVEPCEASLWLSPRELLEHDLRLTQRLDARAFLAARR